MASAIRGLALVARTAACRLPSGVRRAPRPAQARAASQYRQFSVYHRRRDGDDDASNTGSGERKDQELSSDDIAMKILEDMTAAGHPIPESEAETYQSLRRAAEDASEVSDGSLQRDMETATSVREFGGISERITDEPELVQVEVKQPLGFFADDEGSEDMDEDEEFEPDDITSDAHLELEQIRELREFARVMAWDMPLLHSHKQAFQAPTKEQPLRFRYTTYLGEHHPASKKVVLDFSPSALPNLTPVQKAKLIKILGSRYNPQKDIVRMSSELYPTPAQNKRHLASTLDAILKECREGKDSFEDVPYDFRHHRPKVIHKFPEEWKMTDERRQALQESRARQLEAEQQRALAGEAHVDGTRLIESMLAGGVAQAGTQQSQQQKEPVRVPAGQPQAAGGARQPKRR